MQKEAKTLQKKLQEKIIEGESKDRMVLITMNAAQEFIDFNVDDSLLDPSMMDELRKHMKEAFKDYQKKLQKEMMKDLDLGALRGMLGGGQ